MAQLPRKARQTDGVTWVCSPRENGAYLYATYNVPGSVSTRVLRVLVPGAHALAQAVGLIQGRINQQRYAAAH